MGRSTDNNQNVLERRKVLRVLGGALAASVVVSCGGSGASGSSTGTSSTSSSNSSCTVTPEGEEGPYFVDDSASGFNRSDIRSNLDGTNTQDGIPLTLSVYVLDTKNSCAALSGVQVDIWHCNALGVYSAENVEDTTGETWLRGYQVTDSNGLVKFTTIFPGWYEGRTTHIHLRVRSSYDSLSAGGTDTTQLFFPQATIDTIYASVSPYSSRGANSTTNATDHVYSSEVNGETLLTLSGGTSGYSARFNIGVPITSA